MVTVRQILESLERLAPSRFAFSFDRVGLQVGSPEQRVSKAVVSLDRSLAAVAFAHEQGAQLLLSHHPLIFRPIDTVDSRTHVGKTILQLIRSDISFVAAHTNWDCAHGGINDKLAAHLGLTEVTPFGTASDVPRAKLVITVPAAHVEAVLDAASGAGAGVVGAYHRCSFLAEGRGTFVGGEGTHPAIGQVGVREEVDEIRIEMSMPSGASTAVLRAIKAAHPYEEPVIDVYPLQSEREQPGGRVGKLPQPLAFEDLMRTVETTLSTSGWAWGDPSRTIKRIAVVGGAADDEWRNAQRAGADVLITGEVKQHNALEASESGMCLIAAGHYATEHPGCEALRKRMEEAVSEVEWVLFAPPPGTAGRPL
jgi:dinuclear metal center YbgI/SA1388 family protein